MAGKSAKLGLDRIDRKILSLLQEDGRMANVDLAKQVNLSPTPCLERVKRLEREGYIRQYTALLDADKLDLTLVAYIQVTLENTSTRDLDNFNNEARRLAEVQECHMVAGGFDYMIKIRVSGMNHFRRFLGEKLSGLPGVRETHTYVVIQEVKSETAISVPKL
ncbi:Lrp/AsnC ligand binding domain-containing protein [Simiduia agarivorans]|uniref:Leucine-responsive regulatory protein n=1 Tax=Simiduia agarivorans (strain DSM 21679 / JCM 13881 / BCRC 17597 / SA1) TaxID=1117647 RepID=K4KNV9_SIMAS|nr:Lrp/AsnC ligand binding domain-containing protein [Simiduia agarivorans]AFV00865.1 leucine-responsive regulatory protein [Simiduia agarivorans SA1 = DSM 21679]